MKSPIWMAVAAGIVLLGNAGLSGAAAQPPRGAQAPRPAQMQTMKRSPLLRGLARLNLTPDQKAKIKGDMQAARRQFQATRQDTALTQEQKRTKLRETAQTLRGQILSVLTPEQRTKLAQLRREGMLRGRWMVALRQLNLTDQQKKDIQNIVKDHRAKVAVIRSSNLTPPEKRAKALALRQEMQKNILATLTPEQREKLKQMRAQWRPGMHPGRPA